jgi:hypothetical protein
MKKLITICLMCVLLTAVVQADDLKIDDLLHVVQVIDPGYDVPSLWVCEWLELSTEGGTTSWIVHADEDIYDLHFGTWDNVYFLTPGTTPFNESYYECTYDDLGGPCGGPQKEYWQTLDLWDGIMPECTYWEIYFDPARIPKLYGVEQNLWVHPTPEPATICLLGLGALSLLRRKR